MTPWQLAARTRLIEAALAASSAADSIEQPSYALREIRAARGALDKGEELILRGTALGFGATPDV